MTLPSSYLTYTDWYFGKFINQFFNGYIDELLFCIGIGFPFLDSNLSQIFGLNGMDLLIYTHTPEVYITGSWG